GRAGFEVRGQGGRAGGLERVEAEGEVQQIGHAVAVGVGPGSGGLADVGSEVDRLERGVGAVGNGGGNRRFRVGVFFLVVAGGRRGEGARGVVEPDVGEVNGFAGVGAVGAKLELAHGLVAGGSTKGEAGDAAGALRHGRGVVRPAQEDLEAVERVVHHDPAFIPDAALHGGDVLEDAVVHLERGVVDADGADRGLLFAGGFDVGQAEGNVGARAEVGRDEKAKV